MLGLFGLSSPEFLLFLNVSRLHLEALHLAGQLHFFRSKHQGNLITMENRTTTTTAFVVDSPFDSALPRIRRAIRADELCIAGEIDAAQRVRHALEIYVPPCRVLLIDNPAIMLETTAIDRASGIFIPLHLVVSGVGNRTLVHMLNLEHIRHSDLPIGIRAPVLDLQRQIFRSLGRIAERARNPHGLADRGEDRSIPEAADRVDEPKAV